MELEKSYPLYHPESLPTDENTSKTLGPISWKWAARLRLTPELLEKLNQDTHDVSIRFYTAPKTSIVVLQSKEDGTEEEYELLSFMEDPVVNHLSTFSPFQMEAENVGFGITTIGSVHQKMIVQRMLNVSEKTRIKNRHAKSVLDSKARSSQLIESGLIRQGARPTTRVEISRSLAKLGAFSKTLEVSESNLISRMPKSSISKQEAFSIRERIEKERKIKSVLEKEVSFVENDRSEDCSHSIKKCNKNREKKNDKPIEASQSGNTKTKSVKRQRVIAACGDKSASITLPIKQSDSKESIIKRPRPRTPTIPNISNYPESIQQICKRVTRHIGRSAIQDDSDYHSFREQYESYRQDWILLDRMCSINTVQKKSSDILGSLNATLDQDQGHVFLLKCTQSLCRILSVSEVEPHHSLMQGNSKQLMEPPFIGRVTASIGRKWQHLLDRSTIYVSARWTFAFILLATYAIRVLYLNAFHIVTYGLGIYLLNMFIGFLSPQIDEYEGPLLPSRQSEEFRPFTRKVPEFQFWYSVAKATFVSLLLTFNSTFDIPVFWPVLLIYFIILFAMTMKRQIKHMWKHNYVPWNRGKKVYGKGSGKLVK
ncbi:unnamed protein product [Albugo candida]|uniref:Protein RER1 n=1 Tax=Albugo candida TaxID=65357 RepID=A0A024G935_9STRA|nr:unnamed protein product [Albugo candida]|eukprot:CCI43055.1 unnamed protein product [Albugo candida]